MKKSILSLLIAAAVFVSLPHLAKAIINTTNPNVISDNFSNGVKKPDTSLPWDYWYVVLDSADEQGFLRLENIQNTIHTNNAVSLTLGEENDTKYARMSLYPEEFPGVYPGNFNLVQISDQRDGFTYDVPHRWLPTVGHPVTMTTRFRASANYHIDGSGGAVGTFGVWLQNNPNELTEEAKANPSRIDSFIDHGDNFFAFGFNWSDQYTLSGFFRGFKATVVDKYSFAPISTDITNVNINDWVNAKTIWSVDESGTQTVTFFINDQQIASYPLSIPMPSLAIVSWADNEEPQFGPNGLIITYANPTAQQNFDLDSLTVSQE